MSLNLRGYFHEAFCFPRVSGDEPVAQIGGLVGTAFSPRERG